MRASWPVVPLAAAGNDGAPGALLPGDAAPAGLGTGHLGRNRLPSKPRVVIVSVNAGRNDGQ